MPEEVKRIFERRIQTEAQLRAESVGGAKKIVGHAAVFNRQADLGWFIETMKPGAFKRTILEDDVRVLFNHDPNFVLGRNVANTLALSEDETGLMIVCDPPDTQFGRDLMISIERRDITQQSIGFYVRGEDVHMESGTWYRDVTDVILRDVSPVTFPAYESTDVALRTAAEVVKRFRSGPEAPEDPEAWKHELDLRQRQLQIVREMHR